MPFFSFSLKKNFLTSDCFPYIPINNIENNQTYFSKNRKNGAPGPSRGSQNGGQNRSWAPVKSDQRTPKSILAAPGRSQEFILAPGGLPGPAGGLPEPAGGLPEASRRFSPWRIARDIPRKWAWREVSGGPWNPPVGLTSCLSVVLLALNKAPGYMRIWLWMRTTDHLRLRAG